MVLLTGQEPKILLYSKNNKSRFGKDLEKMLGGLALKQKVELFRSITDLALRLRMSVCESSITVLLASDERDLRSFISIQHLLSDRRIVLILPNKEDSTVETGHRLHPRFLSYRDNNVREVEAVLARMIEVGSMSGRTGYHKRLCA